MQMWNVIKIETFIKFLRFIFYFIYMILNSYIYLFYSIDNILQLG